MQLLLANGATHDPKNNGVTPLYIASHKGQAEVVLRLLLSGADVKCIVDSWTPILIAAKNGHFVTITSLMGKFGSPFRSGYCGAKHALHGFFDVLRMEHEKDNIKVTLVCPGFVNTNVSKNALTGDGSKLDSLDEATENGLSAEEFAQKMLKAIYKEKFEVYIGGKETKGVLLKRFFPKLLHKLVLLSKVR